MKKKRYMTVVEAVQYLLGKDEQIDAGTIDSISYENGDLTFTFKDGSTKVVNITTEPLEVEDIEALTDEELENLKAGDIVLKLTDGIKHTYIVTYKEDRVGLCLSYFNFGYSETVSYDYDSEVEAWTLNDVERLNIKQELDNLKTNKQDKLTAGSGITIDPETNEISSDGVTYTAGTGINIDENNEISCTVDASDFVEKKVTGTAQVSTIDRTSIAGIKLESKYTLYSTVGSFVKYLQEAGASAGVTLLIDSSVNNPTDVDANDRARIKAKSKSFLMNLNNSKYSKIISAGNSPEMTESIMLDSSNSYSKTLNPTTNSYSETFKYSPASNIEITVTKEYCKYITSSSVVLSADVTVEEGIYDVTTFVITQNNISIETTTYNSLMGATFDEYKCIKNPFVNLKRVITKSALGLQTTIYSYDTSTTPETLSSTETYAMTLQP